MSAPPSARRWLAEGAALLRETRDRLRGRDLALLSAGLTFYAGIAIVPLVVVAFALTAHLSSPAEVYRLGSRLGHLLPERLGAPAAVHRLVDAGVGLGWQGVLLALLPMSLYGEGLRRALLRFGERRESLTAWRGRLLALPVVVASPFLLYPLLRAAGAMADLADRGGAGATAGRIAIGYYAVLAVLTPPLMWGFRVVAGAPIRWPALVAGALFTAACLSGFLQGFALFLALPLQLGAPFGGLTVVGGVVAIGFWLFLLHLVLLVCWLLTQAVDDRLRRRAAPAGRRGAARPGCSPPG